MRAVKYMLAGGSLFLFICGNCLAFSFAEKVEERSLFFGILLFFCLMNYGSYLYFRRQYVVLTEHICLCLENIIQGRASDDIWNRETLSAKVVTELEKTVRILAFRNSWNKREKKELQETISEITHQIKTPLSNIRMYFEMPAAFDTHIMKKQLARVEFLLDALIRVSRLDADMILLEPSEGRILETLAVAVDRVFYKAEQKQIEISVECRPDIRLHHDMKWTAEAVENVLDNAVKYTPERGKVGIFVDTGEMYTEIRITDTGKGIEAAHVNDIFKRFYREKSVSKTEGIGLGLYLSRKIVELQGGYISVCSVPGKGSSFSICLPNKIYR